MVRALISSAIVTPRDESIDVARGIAIALVVLGHNSALGAAAPGMVAAIFLFHVPLFFMLSGRVLRLEPPGSAALRLARRLLLPFVLAAVLVGAAKCLMRGESLGDTLSGIAWATGQTLPWSHLWFLPALFLALVATQILGVYLRASAARWGFAVLVLTLVTAAVPLADSVSTPKLLAGTHFPAPAGLPWSLDLLPLCLMFVCAGQWLRNSETARRITLHPITAVIGAIAFAAALGATHVDLNMRVFTPVALALTAAFAGCVVTLHIAKLLCRFARVARPLALAGRHTLVIFLLHVSLQKALLGWYPVDTLPPLALGAAGVATAAVVIVLSLLLSLTTDFLRARSAGTHERVAPSGAR